ncbi:hypothetical protein BKA56DRAFT_281608 [Ilyonectria sp. MPI-CAGE-AT-0026]|nr:hypothetical protein BKA56DRAFT_281608 [Ilyonectria sp. MPI-CAGE-AT-0026]
MRHLQDNDNIWGPTSALEPGRESCRGGGDEDISPPCACPTSNMPMQGLVMFHHAWTPDQGMRGLVGATCRLCTRHHPLAKDLFGTCCLGVVPPSGARAVVAMTSVPPTRGAATPTPDARSPPRLGLVLLPCRLESWFPQPPRGVCRLTKMSAMAQSWLHCICGGASTPSPSWSDISSQLRHGPRPSLTDPLLAGVFGPAHPCCSPSREAFVGPRPASWGSLTSHDGAGTWAAERCRDLPGWEATRMTRTREKTGEIRPRTQDKTTSLGPRTADILFLEPWCELSEVISIFSADPG